MENQIYKVRDPTGAIREISGPSGATDEQVIAKAKELFANPAASTDYNAELAQLDKNAESPKLKFAPDALRDFSRGVTTTGRGAINVLNKIAPSSIEPFPYSKPSGSGMEMLGSFVDPAAWAIGGAVGKALPYVPLFSKATTATRPAVQGAGVVTGTAKNIGSGMAMGAPIGLLSAAAEDGDLLKGSGYGAVAGGVGQVVLPPAISGLLKGASAVRQFAYPTPGAIGIKAAGERADDVITALESTRSGVPGVNLTAGQASVPANSAEFAALQNQVAQKYDPSRYFGPTGNKGRQEAARVAAIRDFSGTADDLSQAVSKRGAISGKNYAEAFNEVVKANPDLITISKNPYFKQEIAEASRLAAAESNRTGQKQGLTEFLHHVKEGIDAKIQSSTNPNAPAISNSVKNELQTIKKELVAWLAKNNPKYEAARLAHIDASKPINQMRVGQELESALVAPATGAERASSFGSAVRKAETTVSKSSGKPRIDDLTPTQINVIKSIEDDFKRNAAYKELASKGAANLEDRVGSPEFKSFGMFNPFLSFMRGKINEALGTGHDKAMMKLAPLMENPEQFARLMRNATPKQREIMIGILSRDATKNAAITGGILSREQQGQP